MSSKRYVVFSNANGTDAEIAEFEWPERKSDQHPGGLSPIGIVYEHDGSVYDNEVVMPNVVGKPLSGNPEISGLLGKILTLTDALFVDKEQRDAFKSVLKQTIYGYANDAEEQVRQTYATVKRISNKSK